MPSWEYCQVCLPEDIESWGEEVPEGLCYGPVTLFYSPSEEKPTQRSFKGPVGLELAKLGAEGWELVSHTQTWTTSRGEHNLIIAPNAKVYTFKRQLT